MCSTTCRNINTVPYILYVKHGNLDGLVRERGMTIIRVIDRLPVNQQLLCPFDIYILLGWYTNYVKSC